MIRQGRPAKVFRDLVAGLTGFAVNGQVVRSITDDARSLAAYVAHPADRLAEKAQAARAKSVDECFDFAKAHFGPGPLQHRSEISALLGLARENGTRVVCEIGAYHAGTSVLLSKVLYPDTLVVMDLYTKNRWRLRRAAPDHQAIHIINGDSTQPLVIKRLKRKLRGRKLDLLFIDGDHRWAGVRKDFLNYRQFVRDGGLIAFHDICEVRDHKTEWSGDVPAFWKLVCSVYESDKFVDSENQQGLGIGVLHYDSALSVDTVRDAIAPSGDGSGDEVPRLSGSLGERRLANLNTR